MLQNLRKRNLKNRRFQVFRAAVAAKTMINNDYYFILKGENY